MFALLLCFALLCFAWAGLLSIDCSLGSRSEVLLLESSFRFAI